MKIFHHDDADGFGAGYLVLKEFKDENPETIEMNYTKKFPVETVQEDELVFIVDFSIQPEEMTELLKKTKRVVWIDHHISAIEKYNDYPEDIQGLRYVGISGVGLTWLFLNKGFGMKQLEELHEASLDDDEQYNVLCDMLKEAPWFVRLINSWDVWKFDEPNTEEFITCLNTRLNIDTMSYLELDDYVRGVIETGSKYIEYRSKWAEGFMNKYGYERTLTFRGQEIKCFVANLGNANSKFFGDRIDKYDMLVTYCCNGSDYIYSLYSNKDYVDCAEIAKASGGGGHKGAAGFTYPFSFEQWYLVD